MSEPFSGPIPSTAKARTIEQHLYPTLNTERDWFQTTARAGKLAERENRECGGNNPADRIREPRPTELIRVETNVAIGSAKYPFPEPTPFPSNAVHEPVKTFQPGRYCWYQIKERHYGQRSDPATLLIVSEEYWPTAIRALGAETEPINFVIDSTLKADAMVRMSLTGEAQLMPSEQDKKSKVDRVRRPRVGGDRSHVRVSTRVNKTTDG